MKKLSEGQGGRQLLEEEAKAAPWRPPKWDVGLRHSWGSAAWAAGFLGKGDPGSRRDFTLRLLCSATLGQDPHQRSLTFCQAGKGRRVYRVQYHKAGQRRIDLELGVDVNSKVITAIVHSLSSYLPCIPILTQELLVTHGYEVLKM